MISLEEALKIIDVLPPLDTTDKVRLHQALGRILLQDVYADADMPAFDKSAMDGYACRFEDIHMPLKVIDYVPAGTVSASMVQKGQCVRIMTGAPVPAGADCVLMVEHTRNLDAQTIEFTGKNTKSNICYRGEDIKAGEKILESGHRLNPASLAAAASVGVTFLKVAKRPRVAILATGDELVEAHQLPDKAQIRNSNAYNIQAQVLKTGIQAEYLGIVRDTEMALELAISKALNTCDVLLLTGGVSMGDKDYVPQVLEKLGFRILVNKIAIQPGKPVVFAQTGHKYCFGLSGNPVSSFLQFELLVKPLLYRLMGHAYELPWVKMTLDTAVSRKKAERLQFFPVRLSGGMAQVLEFHGSAHILALAHADGFGTFAIGQEMIESGAYTSVLLI